MQKKPISLSVLFKNSLKNLFYLKSHDTLSFVFTKQIKTKAIMKYAHFNNHKAD